MKEGLPFFLTSGRHTVKNGLSLLKMLIWFEYTASQGRLSIRIAGLWKSTGINLRKFLRRLASLFYTANAN